MWCGVGSLHTECLSCVVLHNGFLVYINIMRDFLTEWVILQWLKILVQRVNEWLTYCYGHENVVNIKPNNTCVCNNSSYRSHSIDSYPHDYLLTSTHNDKEECTMILDHNVFKLYSCYVHECQKDVHVVTALIFIMCEALLLHKSTNPWVVFASWQRNPQYGKLIYLAYWVEAIYSWKNYTCLIQDCWYAVSLLEYIYL